MEELGMRMLYTRKGTKDRALTSASHWTHVKDPRIDWNLVETGWYTGYC
jgi:hypothetical protein